ncbi:unnamed protein product, partial [Rotaria socialis]
LHKYASIIQFIRQHSDSSIIQDPLLLLQAKRLGFSDKQISKYSNCTEIEVCACRVEFHIRPFLKQSDNVPGRTFRPPDPVGYPREYEGKSLYPAGKHWKSLEHGSSIPVKNTAGLFRRIPAKFR